MVWRVSGPVSKRGIEACWHRLGSLSVAVAPSRALRAAVNLARRSSKLTAWSTSVSSAGAAGAGRSRIGANGAKWRHQARPPPTVADAADGRRACCPEGCGLDQRASCRVRMC